MSQPSEENRLAKILSIIFLIVFTLSRSQEPLLSPSLLKEVNENLLKILKILFSLSTCFF